MLNLDTMRAPRADNPTTVKFTLSETARQLLRGARVKTGHDMSTIVDWLIQEKFGGAPRDPDTPDMFPSETPKPATQRDNYGKTQNDPDFEFDV